MLGFESPREPIKGEFAKAVRAALWRANTGHLTEEEIKARQGLKDAAKEWSAVWKK